MGPRAVKRGAAPNYGGLTELGASVDHVADPVGHAPADDSSGTWVRVAEAAAGSNWGSSFTPRIGTEVVVESTSWHGKRPITADTALGPSLDSAMGSRFWLNLRAEYDMRVADRGVRAKIAQRIRALHPVAA